MKLHYFPLIFVYTIIGLNLFSYSNAETQDDLAGITQDIAHFKLKVGKIFGFFAKNRAEVEFEFATKNIYGVDGKPQNSNEKEELERMEQYFKDHMVEIFAIQNLNCTYKLDEIEKKYNKKIHNNTGVIEVEYTVVCDKDLNGSDVQINLNELKNIRAIRYIIKSNKTNRGYLLGHHGIIAIPR